MGIFDKDNKKLHIERNEINNKELKESLANTALRILEEGKEYNQLDNTVCQFGYLFVIEGHGIESLFKIVTDVETFYFAVQVDSILKLDFNEELFKGTVDTFLRLHQ
ncbi:hypothetical protein [Clostridium baratii]|uniref:hypothetical protein n=1 Tax=Clostridium baratii TaxID=1561 RepID=UPI0030CCAB3D